MKPAKKTAAKSTKGRADNGVPVTLRVRPDQLSRLEDYAASKGINRTAAIQLAISELLDRNAKS